MTPHPGSASFTYEATCRTTEWAFALVLNLFQDRHLLKHRTHSLRSITLATKRHAEQVGQVCEVGFRHPLEYVGTIFFLSFFYFLAGGQGLSIPSAREGRSLRMKGDTEFEGVPILKHVQDGMTLRSEEGPGKKQ